MTGLFILIHFPVLLPHLLQLIKQLNSVCFHFTSVQQLFVVLPPRAHVAFLQDKLGRPAVIGRQEVYSFLPFVEPKFVLGHGDWRRELFCGWILTADMFTWPLSENHEGRAQEI